MQKVFLCLGASHQSDKVTTYCSEEAAVSKSGTPVFGLLCCCVHGLVV
jgi:hypothetical protein